MENVIRKHGSTRLKADFKAFNLAINPRLEALLYSGDRLASLTDSPLLPSQLSLQLVNLSYQVTSLKGTKNFFTDNFIITLAFVLSQSLATVTCSVVATKGQKITKAVRSSLQLKVTRGSGVDVMISKEEMVEEESRLLFTFPMRHEEEERYEVTAMFASLHLPGSPLIIPPCSGFENVASQLGFLLKENNEEIDGKAFGKTSYQDTNRVKAEGDTDGGLNKLSMLKQVSRREVADGQHQEQEVIFTQEQTVKLEEDRDSEVDQVLHKGCAGP